jgi:hypothetical protein
LWFVQDLGACFINPVFHPVHAPVGGAAIKCKKSLLFADRHAIPVIFSSDPTESVDADIMQLIISFNCRLEIRRPVVEVSGWHLEDFIKSIFSIAVRTWCFRKLVENNSIIPYFGL